MAVVVFHEQREQLATDEALGILHKHTGSVKTVIDFKKERDEYLSEKYGVKRK